MLTARKAGIVSVSLLLIALVATFGYRYLTRPDRDYTALRLPTRVEMMPEATGEWIEQHVPSENKTLVQYRNGDTGVRYWRPDHTLREESVWFFNGRERMHAVYATDGRQIIDGFGLRDDGTTIWTAQLDERTGYVNKSTFWYDGKTVFSQEKRRVGAERHDLMYFHRNGNKWMHYVGPVVRDTNPSTEDIWNLQGVLVFSHAVGLNETSIDSFYRDDGTLAFQQHWGTYQWPCMDEGCSGPSKVLLQTNVFGANGTTLTRKVIMMDGGYRIARTVDIAANGSYTESWALTTIAIGRIVHYDANDHELSSQSYRLDDNAPKFDVDQRQTESNLGKLDPEKFWKEQEANPALRSADGP